MSTTPPSDPWGTPADRPDQSEPEQPTLDQSEPEQPTLDQPEPEQPTLDQPEPEQPTLDQPEPEQPTLDQPEPEQPAADPWAAPPPNGPAAGPPAETGFERPTDMASGQPPAYPPPAMPPPVPYGEQRPKPTPPSSILTAVKIMYAGAALSALGLVMSLLTVDSARERLAEINPDFTADELDAGVAFGIALAIVFGVLGILLWVWMAESNRRGKSWARIVATVLGGLNIVLTLFGLFRGQSTGLVLVFNLISAALAAVILYLLYRPDSNAYYEAMSDIRR